MRNIYVLTVVIAAGLSVGAIAADMSAAPAPAYKAPVAVPVPSWAGLYFGVNGGGAWGKSTQRDTVLPGGGGTADRGYNVIGGSFGATVGYNWQVPGWVLGLEADADWASIKGSSTTCGTNNECGTKMNAFSTVRGRVGAVSGNTLAYMTGGIAIGNINAYDVSGPASETKLRMGWAVGGGLEQRFSAAWSGKVEYIYADFGRAYHFTLPIHTPESISLTSHVVRAGINYKIGGF